MLGKKSSEARFEATCRGLGHEGKELLATSCLCHGRDRYSCVSAAPEAVGGHRSAHAAARTVGPAASTWISPPAHLAEARGLGREREETLSDLP